MAIGQRTELFWNENFTLGTFSGELLFHLSSLVLSTSPTDMGDTASKIKSCQNGLLLRADINKSSDQYLFPINPDVSLVYHVVFENDSLVQGQLQSRGII